MFDLYNIIGADFISLMNYRNDYKTRNFIFKLNEFYFDKHFKLNKHAKNLVTMKNHKSTAESDYNKLLKSKLLKSFETDLEVADIDKDDRKGILGFMQEYSEENTTSDLYKRMNQLRRRLELEI